MSPEKKGLGKIGNIYLLTTIGTQIVVSVFIGLGMGIFVDKFFGTKPIFLFVFLFFGIVAGFLNLFKVVKKEFGEDNTKDI